MSETLVGTVYLITNTVTNFCYVGETLRPVHTRWDEHQAQRVESAGWFFNRAMREFEPSVWRFETLHTIFVDVLEAVLLPEAKLQLKARLVELELEEMKSRQRLYNMHWAGRYSCGQCTGFRSGTATGLAIHQYLQHAAAPWSECAACVQRVLSARSQSATERKHTGFGLWCAACWLDFKQLYFQHICTVCSARFLWPQGLEKHMDRQHGCPLAEPQRQLYSLLCNAIKAKKAISKSDHQKLWLECGRQVAGKSQPQCFNGIFYF